MTPEVEEYLKGDRQWFRDQRLAHAKYKLSIACLDDTKAFWREVIEALTTDEDAKIA